MAEQPPALKNLIPPQLIIDATNRARDILEEHRFEPDLLFERVNGLLHRLDDEIIFLPGDSDKVRAIVCEAALVTPEEVTCYACMICKTLPPFTAIFFSGLDDGKPGRLQNGDLLVLLDPAAGLCMKHDGTMIPEQLIEIPKKFGRLATTLEILDKLHPIDDTLETIPAAPAAQVDPPWYVIFPFGDDGEIRAENARPGIEADARQSGKIARYRGNWSVLIPAVSEADGVTILSRITQWDGFVRPRQFTPSFIEIVDVPAPLSDAETQAMVTEHATLTGMSIADAARDLGFDTGIPEPALRQGDKGSESGPDL